MRRVGLTDPVYRQGTGSVKLRLEAVARLPPEIAGKLPPNSQQILDQMRVAGIPMGTGDIQAAVEMSRPAVITRLKALQEAGLVKWTGRSQQDPRAVWSLTTP